MANKSVSGAEEQLRSENEELHLRLTEAEETLFAIRNGEVDAIVVSGVDGARIFSLTSGETPYRIMMEEMHEGAATLMADTSIIYCNNQFAKLLARPAEQILGGSFIQFIGENEKPAFIRLFTSGLAGKCSGEITYLSPENEVQYFHLSFSPLPPNVTGDVCMIVSDFTERKQAEETLHSQVFLNSVIENSPNALWILDEKGTLNQMNQASRTLFGIQDNKVLGKYNIFEDQIFEEQEFKSLINDVFENGSNHRFVIRYDSASIQGIEAAQTKKLDLDVSISPIHDAHGKMTNAVVQFIDITKSKLAEQELILANKELIEKDIEYSNLANSGPSMTWSSGTDKLCKYFNNTWLSFTGRTLEQEIGNGWVEGVHPDDFDSCLETYVTAFDNRKPFEMEYRLKHACGAYKWILDLGTPIYKTDHEFIGYIGNCFDITDRKFMEQELLEAEWKFRALFDNGPIGVAYHELIYDSAGNPIDYRFIDVNSQYIELTGVDPRGKTVKQVFPDIENDPFDWIGTYAQVVRTGKSLNFEQYFMSNDRWYNCVAFHYRPDQFVVAFFEITKRKQAEEDLQKKMDELLQFQRLTVNRELKMIELKKEINELLKGSGKDEKYRIVE